MGAHPFRIQSTANGSTGTAYNDGITNNDVSNGTLTWHVQHDAPNKLYYQCTSHGSMGGVINILGGTADNFSVTANNSTNETVYPVFVDGATGSQGAETDTGLNYNPSTGNLSATKFTGDGSGLTGISGGGGSSGVASTITVADESSDTTCFPVFVTSATGNVNPKSGTNLTFNSSDGTLTATTFSGSLSGNATSATTATTATNVTVTANNSTNETVYPIFVDGATGSQGAETDTGLSYNPSTGVLTTTAIGAHSVSGTLTTQAILPDGNGTRDLGATGTRWANLYTSDIDLSNEAKGGNEVDGTWGSYTIQEGENDLFLINRRNGKKYKFVLQEIS